MSIRSISHRFTLAALAVAALALASRMLAAGAGAPAPISFSGEIDATAVAELAGPDGRVHFFVELEGIPAARAWAARLAEFGGDSPAARAAAALESRRQAQENRLAQASLESQLLGGTIGAQEIYRLSKVANGFVVRAEPGKFAAISRLPGVRAVRVLYPEEPSNSTSVPFIDAPPAWGDTLGVGTSLTGAGVSIGIIDTGIDYQHTHFGGSGLLADYQANDRTVAPDAFFPTAKVIGGIDLVGDTYNAGGNGGTTGSTTPVPDEDPMDCNRHGSHVAGTAAGYGVTAAGATFTGPWNTATPFAGMRIGPGVAPEAELYAIRVFGCQGSTVVTAEAIEWTTDPNEDDDFTDHLDVINLSLGSNHGGANDLSAQAAENAALLGVLVLAASGNAGDTHFITSSPGVASRAISVAASQDSGLPGAFLTVNSPPAIAGNYAAAASAYTDPTPPPPPAASGQTANVILVDDGSTAGPGTVNDGCQTPFVNAAAVAGNIALMERGGCNFNVKVQNAQTTGAIGAIIANNLAGDPVPNVMGGAATIEILIPGISVSRATGDAIRAQLLSGPVGATLNGATGADTIASFSSRGPRRASSPIKLKPEITAPGLNITSTQTGVSFAGGSCSPACNASFANAGLNAALTISGTSMATPHMAGVMALLRQEHPTWTVEELKALAMNYSNHNVHLGANNSGARFGPGRVGSGRVDVAQSVVGQVIAMSKDDPGLVTVTFPREVVSNLTVTRTVRVVNHGATAQTYDLAIDTVVDAPGVALSFPGGSTVAVPAGGTAEFAVQLAATASAMDNSFDSTLATTQAVTAPAALAGLGGVARHRLTEEAGYLNFSQSGNLRLRVPFYSAPRPASAMAGGDIATGGAGSGSTTIPLSGTDVCTGTLGAGPACTGSFPTDEVSLVSPFELQLSSPREPDLALVDSYGDIRHVGVTADAAGTNILFGVSSWANWSSPNETVYNIWIDNNEDGTWDRVVFNSSVGQVSSRLFGSAADTTQDNFLSFVFTPPGTVAAQAFINTSPATADSELHHSGVQLLVASAATLGLTAGNNDFRYRVESCPWFAPLCSANPSFVPGSGIDNTGPGFATWNRTARGLDFGGGILFEDLNGDSLPVTWNTANLAANGSIGALLLHHHNAEGNQAQVVLLDVTPSADLAIAKSMNPPTPVFSQNVTFTVTVTNQGPDPANAIEVIDALPPGLQYVSDNGGGAYDSGTGVWTVPGSLANGAGASLQIVATVLTTDAVDNTATLSSANLPDPDSSDNSSTVTVNAAEVADIQLDMAVGSPTVLAGNAFTVNLTATNNGNDSSFSIAVNELFTGFEPLAPTASVPSDGVYDGSTGLWNVASLGNGNNATLALTFTAPNMAGPLTNNGSAGSAVSDPINANNTASATITVLSPATITSTKTVAGSFVVGGTVTYTVILSNSSAFDQQNNAGNEFTDVLPPQLALVSAAASSGAASTSLNTVTWNGVVPANGSVTITITATINAGTELQTVSNQGTTTSDADGNGVNEITLQTDDPGVAGAANPTVFTVLSPAAVSSTKTVAGSFVVGGTVTYTVILANSSASGQQNNPGDEFTDVLPSQLTLVSAIASSGTISTAVNTVTWNGVIPGSGSVTITITATINAGTELQSVSNQGTTASDADGNGVNETNGQTDDPIPAGANDPTVFTVGSPAALTATKTVVSSGPYLPGALVSYEVVITNNSASLQNDNPGNEFEDILPSELNLVSATASSGAIGVDLGTNTVTWNGSLAGGASVTITIDATIGSLTGNGTITNQGTVFFDADGNGTNESSGPTDDPTLPGGADGTSLIVGDLLEVPALSQIGLLALALLLAGAAWVALRRG